MGGNYENIPKFIMENDLPCLNYVKGIPGKFGFDLYLKNYVAVYSSLGMKPIELARRCSVKSSILYCERASTDENVRLINLTNVDKNSADKIRKFFSSKSNQFMQDNVSRQKAEIWVEQVLNKESPYSCCGDYYKSFNPNAECCSLCPLSRNYKNHSAKQEFDLLRACVASRAVFDRANAVVKPADFYAVYDVAGNDKSRARPVLIPYTRIFWKFLSNSESADELFGLSSVSERVSVLERTFRHYLLQTAGADAPNGLSGTVAVFTQEVFGSGEVWFESDGDMAGVVDAFLNNLEARRNQQEQSARDGVPYPEPPKVEKCWGVASREAARDGGQVGVSVSTLKIDADGGTDSAKGDKDDDKAPSGSERFEEKKEINDAASEPVTASSGEIPDSQENVPSDESAGGDGAALDDADDQEPPEGDGGVTDREGGECSSECPPAAAIVHSDRIDKEENKETRVLAIVEPSGDGGKETSLPEVIIPVRVVSYDSPLGEHRPYEGSNVSVPTVKKEELLSFATCLDTADARTLTAFMNSLTGGLRPCRKPVKAVVNVELAYLGGNEYVFLFFVPVMGRYFFTSLKKGDARQIVADAMKYGGLVKYTYMPFMLTAALRMCGIKTVRNLKSIYSELSVLAEDQGPSMQICLEGLGAVCWHGMERAEQASPVIRYLHCYHRVYEKALSKIRNLGLLKAYEETAAIDEVLSVSFLHKTADGAGCLFRLEGFGNKVFPLKTNAVVSGQSVWCYHADPSVPEAVAVFRDLLLLLNENRSLRKTDAVLLSVGKAHFTVAVKKKDEALLRECVLNCIEEITSKNGYRYFEYRRTRVAPGQRIVPADMFRK